MSTDEKWLESDWRMDQSESDELEGLEEEEEEELWRCLFLRLEPPSRMWLILCCFCSEESLWSAAMTFSILLFSFLRVLMDLLDPLLDSFFLRSAFLKLQSSALWLWINFSSLLCSSHQVQKKLGLDFLVFILSLEESSLLRFLSFLGILPVSTASAAFKFPFFSNNSLSFCFSALSSLSSASKRER